MSNDKYNWYDAVHDYGHGWRHGFQSRGIAPSFIGSDSLPQGLSDLHWALHGIQHNMDVLDAKVNTINDSTAKTANDMKNAIIDGLSKTLIDNGKNGTSPLNNENCHITKVMTTRTRIFSDSFGPETNMPTNDRIRGLTKNYNWIQSVEKNPTCEGEYDKIIDFNFISDYIEDDNLDSRYVTKGKIVLDKAGLIKRVHVTQHGTNIVLWYLVTQSIPSETGVSYTGSVRRVEYNYNSELVSEKWVPLNHTPLILLGAFSENVNDEKEFIQYISTDYKVYQSIDGSDKELGKLPNDIIMLIDPLNDILSDSKQAYIIKYDSQGNVIFPLEGFTLIDTISNGKITDKFSKISLSNETRLINSIVSISPRVDTMLFRRSEDGILTIEGGYYIEVYDNKHTNLNVSHSHIFLLSSTKEAKNTDMNTPNFLSYYSDKPSQFSFKRERDYTEFNNITFKSGISKMFPEVSKDFGIPDDVPFTLENHWSTQKERVTVWLKEPLVLERNISKSNVNNRLGYTVVTNSDYVKDISDTDILSVYRKLDFVNKTPTTRNYLKTLPKYDESYQLPKYLRYKVVDHSDVERGAGKIEVTYFDEINSVSATIDAPRKEIIGNIKYNENLTEVYNSRSNKFSPSVNSQYLSDLIHSDVIYLEGKDFLDKPYGSKQYVLKNETTGSRVTQRLYTSTTGNSDTNNDSGTTFKARASKPIKRRVPKESSSNGSLNFNVEDVVDITTSNEQQPMSFIFILDASPSYYTKMVQAVDYMIHVVTNCVKNPESNIMIQTYHGNNENSYRIRNDNTDVSSILMSKDVTLRVLSSMKDNLANHLSASENTMRSNITSAMGDNLYRYDGEKPFEDIFEEQPNKHNQYSVLQITDGWSRFETIDTSYANWAKKAVTFMSAVDRTDRPYTGNSTDRALEVMRSVGHPNIYDMTGVEPNVVKSELSRKFLETAVVKQTKKYRQSTINITRTGEIEPAVLELSLSKGSQPIQVNSNSATIYSGELSKGSYSLNAKLKGTVNNSKSITITVKDGNDLNKTLSLTLNPAFDEVTENSSNSGNSSLAKHYSNIPVEETVFTRTISNGKVGEWFGSGYITDLKYLNIPGSYNTGTLENGAYFQSENPSHEVFSNIVTRGIFVEGITNNMTHVVYRLTNDIGLSMSYHNIVIREDRTDNVGYTSKPWRLLYDKWIPGEYIGNDEFPLGPDADSVTKYILSKLGNTKQLEQRLKAVEDALKSIVGSLRRSGAWDPNATPDPNTSLSGGVKSGIDIAYGNINLFGGTPDGDHYIRTNSGQTEDDLAGGI